MINKRLNQSGIAKVLGVTRQRVSQLVRDGVLKPGSNGLFDVDRARAAYHAHVGSGPTVGNSDITALVEAKRKQVAARTELLESTAELQQQRAAERRGTTIQTTAAAVMCSQILERVYRNLDSSFFRFLNHMPGVDIIAIDVLYRDAIRTAFQRALQDRHIAKHNQYLRDKCDLIVSEIDAQIVIFKHQKRDFETLEACRKFAGEMQALLFDMTRPDIVKELMAHVPPRLQSPGEAHIDQGEDQLCTGD
jgi:phage terminase Nu1 subunit (DNA packaging protein)